MKKIKEKFPRLKLCVLGDSLYAAETIIEICRGYQWNYILNYKDGRQKNLTKDYAYVLELPSYKNI